MNSVNSITFRDFERTLCALGRSARTIQNYGEALDQLADFHEDRDVLTLSKGDVEAYIARVQSEHSSATAANRFSALRRFYNWAVDEEELIEKSPMARLKKPQPEEKPVPVIPDDAFSRLLATCAGKDFLDRRDEAILRLMAEPGGPRREEIVMLEIDNLDMSLDVIFVRGKGNRLRAIPFGAKTGRALSRYVRARMSHRYANHKRLWLSSPNGKGQGVPLTASGLTQMLRRRGQAAGIGPIRPHQIRHTAAHVWFASGGSETDAMRLFGWKSRSMLSRYGASAADERAQEASRRLALGDRF